MSQLFKMKNWIILFVLISSFTLSCSSKDEDKEEGENSDEAAANTLAINIPVDVTPESIAALPTINEPGKANPEELDASTLDIGTNLVGGLVSSNSNSNNPSSSMHSIGDPVNVLSLQGFFAFECWGRAGNISHDQPFYVYCPKAIADKVNQTWIPAVKASKTKSGMSSMGPYQFSSFSILGMVFTSEILAKYAYSKEGEAKVVKPESISFAAGKDYKQNAITEKGDPDKYLIPIQGIYNRYFTEGWKHYLYNGDAKKDGRYSVIPWHKGGTMGGGGLQSYMTVEKDGKTARIYAVNQVLSSSNSPDEGARMILLINFKTEQFLAKLGNDRGKYGTIIAGKGGFDIEKGVWKEGAYFAEHFHNGHQAFKACVDNKTATIIGLDTKAEKCQFVADFFDKTKTFSAAKFLELNDVEEKDLTGFLSFFEDAEPLADEQVPEGTKDVANIFDQVTF